MHVQLSLLCILFANGFEGFYQNAFMTVFADHPIACLKQICLGERLEGFEEQMILKNSSLSFLLLMLLSLFLHLC